LSRIFKYVTGGGDIYIYIYIYIFAGNFAYMARMVLYNQHAEVTSSSPPQKADVYSPVFLGVDAAETDSPSVLFVRM